MLLYQKDAEILFPARLIPLLRDLRTEGFQDLVETVLAHQDEAHPDVLAFVLMMIRLSSCITCSSDSFRAMGGCTRCSRKTLRNFRGSDEELRQLWRCARQDVDQWQESGLPPRD